MADQVRAGMTAPNASWARHFSWSRMRIVRLERRQCLGLRMRLVSQVSSIDIYIYMCTCKHEH